jgi:hypothetical protein
MSILGLRFCDTKLQSWEGFQWKDHGLMEAPDWRPDNHCGGGLHFYPWGESSEVYHSVITYPKHVCLVLKVEDEDYILIDNFEKAKCSKCQVVYAGDLEGAANFIIQDPVGRTKAVAGASKSEKFALVGDYGTAISKDRGGLALAGYNGIACAGNYAIARVGLGGTAKSGDFSFTDASRYSSTGSVGDHGILWLGSCGTGSVGRASTAIIQQSSKVKGLLWAELTFNGWTRGNEKIVKTIQIGRNGYQEDQFYGLRNEEIIPV